jgi:trigger factor
MNITTKQINTANATVDAIISKEYIEKKENALAAKAAKDMKIDGFRKGKVPAHVVKARYGEKLNEDARNEAIREVYEKALAELNIDASTIIGEPSVTKFEEKDDGSIETEIKIALRPEIKIENYKDLIPEIEQPVVEDSEVDAKIKDMLASSATLKKVEEDRAVVSGDHTLIDFEGFLDGEPFKGGKAEAYTLEIGSNSFISGFEDQIIGMKVDEERDINVTFPKEYHAADLAGKEVVFKVKLLEIQEKVIPTDIDEETLKKFLPNEESPTEEKLKEEVSKQLKAEKLSKIHQEDTKPKFVEALVKTYNIDLPSTIVEQEIDMSFRNALGEMEKEEVEKYSTDVDAVKAKREEYRSDAEDSVKLTFIVDSLAKTEEIEVSDQDVMQTIYFEALQSGQDPQAYVKQYEEQGLLPAVKMAIIEERLFKKLFSEK